MSLPLASGAWSLDPAHSVVEFTVRHLGISLIRGRFTEVSATLDVGRELGESVLSAEVGMASVTTGDENRDGHLRSTEIFNVESQPKMGFTSTAMTDAGGGRYQLTGEMTINGTTNSETLDVTFGGTQSNPLDGSTRAGFSATGAIDRTVYGIDWNVPMPGGGAMLSNTIDLMLDAQFIAPSDG